MWFFVVLGSFRLVLDIGFFKDDYVVFRGFKGGLGSVELSFRFYRVLGFVLGFGFLVVRCFLFKVFSEIFFGFGYL